MKLAFKLVKLTTLALCMVSTNLLAAPILSFNNSGNDLTEDIKIGDSTTLELWISDLDTTSDLGGFDIFVDIDRIATSLDSVSYAGLTEFDLLGAIDANANPLELSGLSFALDLSAQADSFALAEFSFTGLQAGATEIDLSSVLLSDAFGQAIGVDAFQATINVTGDNGVVVDEPIPLMSVALGLLLLGARARRRS